MVSKYIEVQYLTGENEDQLNLNQFIKAAKFKLISLNSNLIQKLNSSESRDLSENQKLFNHSINYESINQSSNKFYDESVDPNSAEQKEDIFLGKSKTFKLKPKKRLLKLLRSLNFKRKVYDELRSSKEDEEKKKKKKKKLIKRIKKITIDVCKNIGSGVEMVNGSYNYSDHFYDYHFNNVYDQYDVKPMYLGHNCNYKVNNYNYTSTLIYGPRYM